MAEAKKNDKSTKPAADAAPATGEAKPAGDGTSATPPAAKKSTGSRRRPANGAGAKSEPTADTPSDADLEAAVALPEGDVLGQERGFIGDVPDGPPNSAFSLESGPDSPSASESSPRPRVAASS